MSFNTEFEYRGLCLNPAEIWFLSLSNPAKPDLLGLRVGIPNLMPGHGPTYVDGVRALLVRELGEQRVKDELHHIEVVPLPPEAEKQGYLALSKLPTFLEWKKTHNCEADHATRH